jgi:DNA repair exonuclease SbcCD nuclease subunit
MKYRIVTIADIHWGVMDAQKQYDEFMLVLLFLQTIDRVDLVVVCGDWFDKKLSMNSSAALLAIRAMNELYRICKEKNIKIRIVKGTESHDNAQLNAFEFFNSDDGEMFKIISINTLEDVLPGLKVLYCPDENINTDTYFDTYLDNLCTQVDIMFFHGSFDVAVPSIVLQESENGNTNNVVFKYDYFSYMSRLMIGGHWHNGEDVEDLYYVRSLSRWEFNEEEPKGFLFTTYDTDTKKYYCKRIENIFTDEYKTFNIDTYIYNSIELYNSLIKDVDELVCDREDIKVRIVINITDDKEANTTFVSLLRSKYSGDRKVKLVIKNAVVKKKKKEEIERHERINNKFAFVRDKSLKHSKIIQEYIYATKNIDVPIESIESVVDKYLIK